MLLWAIRVHPWAVWCNSGRTQTKLKAFMGERLLFQVARLEGGLQSGRQGSPDIEYLSAAVFTYAQSLQAQQQVLW